MLVPPVVAGVVLTQSPQQPIRIGVLGTARVVPYGMLRPARGLRDVEIVAVASRSRDRARRFAAAHGIPRAHEGYASLLMDGGVDAVYNALPVTPPLRVDRASAQRRQACSLREAFRSQCAGGPADA